MKPRYLCVVVAALLGGVIGLLIGPTEHPLNGAANAKNTQVIPQIPEQQYGSKAPTVTIDDLERCLAAGSCATLATDDLGDAHIDVIQQDPEVGDLPSIHFVTTVSDSEPKIWSLEDEHGGTFIDLTCALTNCVVTVDVADEMHVLLDLRVIDHRLQGLVEGAAFTSSTNVYVLDLNSDGVLDAAIAEELATPSSSSPYYRTVVSSNGTMTTTGCTIPGQTTTLPMDLLTRTCPAAA